MIRTPKTWVEICSACGGTGAKQCRQRFALWTPEEWDVAVPGFERPKLDPKYDAPSDAYVCEVHGGASIFDACKEGVEIAKAVQRPVVFEFNGAIAVLRADSDWEQVAKAWWKRVYGETYEEAMARR